MYKVGQKSQEGEHSSEEKVNSHLTNKSALHEGPNNVPEGDLLAVNINLVIFWALHNIDVHKDPVLALSPQHIWSDPEKIIHST